MEALMQLRFHDRSGKPGPKGKAKRKATKGKAKGKARPEGLVRVSDSEVKANARRESKRLPAETVTEYRQQHPRRASTTTLKLWHTNTRELTLSVDATGNQIIDLTQSEEEAAKTPRPSYNESDSEFDSLMSHDGHHPTVRDSYVEMQHCRVPSPRALTPKADVQCCLPTHVSDTRTIHYETTEGHTRGYCTDNASNESSMESGSEPWKFRTYCRGRKPSTAAASTRPARKWRVARSAREYAELSHKYCSFVDMSNQLLTPPRVRPSKFRIDGTRRCDYRRFHIAANTVSRLIIYLYTNVYIKYHFLS